VYITIFKPAVLVIVST